MKKFFPWRLFRSIFFTIVLLSNVLFFITLGLASYIIEFNFYQSQPFIVLGLYFIFSLFAALFLAYRYSRPLQRLIVKSLRLLDEKHNHPFSSEEEILDQDFGEFGDLERALEQIRKKLKRRRIQLAIEREESKALMTALDDAIVAVDVDDHIKYYNDKFSSLFFSKEVQKLLAENKQVSFSQLMRGPEVLNIFRDVLNSGEVKYYRLKLGILADSDPHYFSVTVSPLISQKTSEVYGALALLHDVTDLKKAEHIRNEFVANASHELRTPLTSIKGYVETLKEDLQAGKPEQALGFVEIISRGVDRLGELVNDMLQLAHLESGIGLKKDTVDPKEISEEVLEHVGAWAKDKKIELSLDCRSQPFRADADRLEQVLVNLLSNAIKYVPEGGKVQVLWSDAGDQAKLQVIDNGPGIDREHLPRIFERFYRVDKGRARSVGGTGLGLSIVKHIMQAHGGQIIVKSEPGQGSEFTCIFPR